VQQPVSFARFFAAAALVALLSPSVTTPVDAARSSSKLDRVLSKRMSEITGWSRVIVRATDRSQLGAAKSLVRQLGGNPRKTLAAIDGEVVDVPNRVLSQLAASPLVGHVSLDRDVSAAMDRTGRTVGAVDVRQQLGLTGAGVGVAIVDSGITPWHDDLGGADGQQRTVRFVDFLNGGPTPYDDLGHGTHVAGIIGGNGFDSGGARSGIAPAANLVVLKVLDGEGRGRASDVIAAIAYAIEHKDELNIRVINLSIASAVFESYEEDPLTLAAKQAVSAGIVVVAASGNNGRSADGQTLYGGTTSPGNAPWVLTVGASSHGGTIDRADDTMAPFSSRGPSAIDIGAKPDLVAPGVGIESLSDPASAFYLTRAPYLLPGTVPTAYLPYLSLSGTSMSAPVVTGTVALMLEANPGLGVNQVKAILQYTSQTYADYDPLTQGAGFLNASGAIQLAAHFAAPESVPYPESDTWGKRLIWGNHLVSVEGSRLTSTANAWTSGVTWGQTTTPGGQTVRWGVICVTAECEWTKSWKWQNAAYQNVVWGTACGSDDCSSGWSASTVSTTSEDGDTVVWGTTDDGDTVVWGTLDDGDTVVWGTACSDPSCEPVIWPGR
jgi:serine protease AprX